MNREPQTDSKRIVSHSEIGDRRALTGLGLVSRVVTCFR